MRRRAALALPILMALLLVATPATLAAASRTVFHQLLEINHASYSPCHGEYIHWRGVVETTVTYVYDDSGGATSTYRILAKEDGIGVGDLLPFEPETPSGATYLYVGNVIDVHRWNDIPAGDHVISGTGVTRVVSRGAGPNYVGVVTYQFVFDERGALVSIYRNFGTCLG
jgi:hypothetical protein